jgi:hypothetical protein
LKRDKTPLELRFARWIFPKLERVSPALSGRYFIRFFFRPLSYDVPNREKKLLGAAVKSTIEFGGRKIQCYSWGEGPIVLLVHGWGGRPTQFRKFIDVLTKKGYQVVGFDGPAHGLSEGRSTTLKEFESVLKKVIEKTGTPEVIIANCFGGGVVLSAAMNGLEVKKLINIASHTMGDETIATFLRALNGSWKTGNYFKEFIVRQSGKSFDEQTSLHFIRNITSKIDLLLVYDDSDTEVIISNAYELMKLYPAALLLKTEGLGHARILRDKKVIEQCVTFISQNRLA